MAASVLGSRTCGLWGIWRLEPDGRAYLLQFEDEEPDPFDYQFFSAWSPISDDKAHESAFLIAYDAATRLLCMPPHFGATIEGPPDLLVRAMVAHFDRDKLWDRALEHVVECRDRLPVKDEEIEDLALATRSDATVIRDAVRVIEEESRGLAEFLSTDEDLKLGLGAVYLATVWGV